MTLLNFAYGSNMLVDRIRGRASTARPLGVAELLGYGLRWHKRGMDGSGKCDVVPSVVRDDVVLGVLYEVSQAEKRDLDRAEGLGKGYSERSVTVRIQGVEHEAAMYYATDVDTTLKPYSWYKALVIAGARQHALPQAYVAAINAIETILDEDHDRHENHMRIASSVACVGVDQIDERD